MDHRGHRSTGKSHANNDPPAARIDVATPGTDTDVIFWTRGGIPSALISLPNRQDALPVEIVSLKVLEQIPWLMAAFALSQSGRTVQGEDLIVIPRFTRIFGSGSTDQS